jgi:hypothetical protein
MSFLKTAQELDKIITNKSMRLLKTRGFLQESFIKRLNDDELYLHSIFYNLYVEDKVLLYKIFNSVNVWLIKNINENEYKEYLNLYLKSNQTKHGKELYETFIKNPEKYYDYFKDEMNKIINKTGLLFILTEKDKDDNIIKICHFYEFDFEKM